jgi:hypothetical protein
MPAAADRIDIARDSRQLAAKAIKTVAMAVF